MVSLKTCLVTFALGALGQAANIKIIAQTDNTFNPSNLTAAVGDVLVFHFQPRNHSVVAGDYKHPCSPLPSGSGFFSGFMDVQSGEGSQLFKVNVTNTQPMVFYSSQGNECPLGMIGMVNADSKTTLSDYKKRAAKLTQSVTPGQSPYGGNLVHNAASGNLRVPVAAIAAVVGAVAFVV